MRPRLLDLFCGAGGAAMGYAQAGFEVVGVDVEFQPHYPFEFIRTDAMRVLDDLAANGAAFHLGARSDFAVIHASPPCQAYSTGAPGRKRSDHPDLLPAVRARLKAIRLPYVVENVPGAPMPSAHLFCGVTFGLPLIRHRLFEIEPDLGLIPSLCPQESRARGVTHGPNVYAYAHGKWRANWREHVLPVVWPWMTVEESGQAIPPAYTEYIGRQLLEELGGVRGDLRGVPAEDDCGAALPDGPRMA